MAGQALDKPLDRTPFTAEGAECAEKKAKGGGNPPHSYPYLINPLPPNLEGYPQTLTRGGFAPLDSLWVKVCGEGAGGGRIRSFYL